MALDPNSRWARYLGTAGGGCTTCRKTRSKILHALNGDAAAVLFSGGLDSTYAAVRLKEQGLDVTLYTAEWQYADDAQETYESYNAKRIAEVLDLPLENLGYFEVAEGHKGNLLRVPTLMSALLSHKSFFDIGPVLAFGGHPSTYELDARWVEFGNEAARVLRPGTRIITPCDGASRKDMWEHLPDAVKPLIWSCYDTDPLGRRCGVCNKCKEDVSYLPQSHFAQGRGDAD